MTVGLDILEKQCCELSDLENYCGDDREERREKLANEILEAVEPLVKTVPDKGRAMSIMGFAMSWTCQKAEAEELLSRAIKLDSTLERAWARLGELCCEKGDGVQAQLFFEEALEQVGRTPLLLRNLSITLRGLQDNRTVHFAKALQCAKDAVALDPDDGTSWETLGNAYFGDFFLQPCPVPDILKRVLIAYNKAEEIYNQGAGASAILYRNRAVVYKFMEHYSRAIDDFRKAASLGGTEFKACTEEADAIHATVRKISNHCSSRGRLKLKKLESMARNVECGYPTLSELTPDQENTDVSTACNICSVETIPGEVPLKIICHDRTGAFFCLSLYNCDYSRAIGLLKAGESLIVARPYLRQVTVDEFAYTSIRCGHPGDITLRGTGRLSSIAVASQFSQRAD